MSNLKKSKVLSVRLHLEDLQSCFDLCELLGHPTNGASGAISRACSVMMQDLRRKKVVPSYQPSELEILVAQFIQAKNPTSMMSLENLNNFESREFSSQSGEFSTSSMQIEIVGRDNEDFAPFQARQEVEPGQALSAEYEQEASEFLSKQDEFNDLVDSQIRETQQEEADALLRKILIGG